MVDQRWIEDCAWHDFCLISVHGKKSIGTHTSLLLQPGL